jgi:hypothetical protein
MAADTLQLRHATFGETNTSQHELSELNALFSVANFK